MNNSELKHGDRVSGELKGVSYEGKITSITEGSGGATASVLIDKAHNEVEIDSLTSKIKEGREISVPVSSLEPEPT